MMKGEPKKWILDKIEILKPITWYISEGYLILGTIYNDEDLAKGNKPRLYKNLKKPKHILTFKQEGVGVENEINNLLLLLQRRKRRFKNFFDVFEPLYKQRKISFLLITLTTPYTLEDIKNNWKLAKELRVLFQKFWKAYRIRYLRRLNKIYGILKIIDVGEQGEKLHYHIVIAIPRIRVSKIPKWLKPDEGLWKWLSKVEFIKKSVRGYLAKYLGKPMFDLPKGWRSYEVRINKELIKKLTK